MTATTVQQQQQNILAGDWEQLTKVLRTVGVSESEISELSTAVEQDGEKVGSRVEVDDQEDRPEGVKRWREDWDQDRSKPTSGVSEAIF